MTQPAYYTQGEQPISVGEWLITIILTAIPIVGLVLLVVWAFGGGTNTTKANWAKATLIVMVAGIVLVVGFYILVFAIILASGAASTYVS